MRATNLNKIIGVVSFFVVIGTHFLNAQNRPAIHAAKYQEGLINIKVKVAFSNICYVNRIDYPGFDDCLKSIQALSILKKFPHHKAPVTEFNQYQQKLTDLTLIYSIRLNPQQPIEKAITILMHTGILEYAEPQYIQELFYTPNDPSVSVQYYLNKINAFQAWNLSQSDTNVVIGITDTGTEIFHEDLYNNIKFNYLDTIDGIDNDTDGYIDNFYGWDLGENDNIPQCNANYHGLHSAGISSAVADNNKGIAGVGFKAKYLPIKISDAGGTLNTSYEGIVYAADHGAQIINCSWGGLGASQFGQDVINYAAINNQALVVASAGNNGDDALFYPASYQNVFNVAATDQNDHKKANSSFGTSIDVCAPGEDILSTWINNSYISSGGTSTAAPVVSGAAAVVKSYFPNYSGIQVGEQLRATADVIDTIPFNSVWNGKLGSGRINLFRALTDTSAVSVVLTESVVNDNNDNAFVVGDTLVMSGVFTNYLHEATNVNVLMSCDAPFVTLLDSAIALGNLSTMQTINNTANPFRAKINIGAPSNAPVHFKLLITDASGHSFVYYISTVVNVDFLNITINDVATTITSKGNIGYNNNSSQGLGFVYNNSNLLYEAGLLVGSGPNRVSDRIRETSGNDIDFVALSNVYRVTPGVYSEFDVNGIFNDDGALTDAIPVKIMQHAHAWSTPADSRYVIFKYEIINTGAVVLDNLFAGIFADWDILNSNLNKSAYDAPSKTGYSYSTQAGGLYAGIKLLSSTAPPLFYAMDNISGGAGGIDPVGGLTTNKKFTAISTTRLNAGGSGNGNDIINFMSSGPYVLSPTDTAVVAFALIAGDSLADIQNSAAAAQIKYDNDIVTTQKRNYYDNVTVFPNPTQSQLNIMLPSTNIGFCKVILSDINGRIVKEFEPDFKTVYVAINTTPFCNGIYILRLVTDKYVYSQKVIIQN